MDTALKHLRKVYVHDRNNFDAAAQELLRTYPPDMLQFVTVFVLSGAIIPGLVGTMIMGAAIGMGLLGGLGLATQAARAGRGARYVASTALVEAEHGSSRALPPGDGY